MNLKNFEFLYPEKGLILISLFAILFFYIFVVPRLTTKRLFFSFLRILIFVLLTIFLFQPQYNLREKLTTKSSLAILLDNSQSMNVNEPSPRWEKIKTFFAKEPFRKLSEKYQILFYTFSDTAKPWEKSDTFFPHPVGKTTNITQALEEISKTENLNGIILFTDGQYTQGGDPLTGAQKINLPVYCVGVGNPQPKDLLIGEIKHSGFGFKNVPMEIEVNLRGYGFEEQEIAVTLEENKQIIQTQNVKLSSAGKGKVTLRFIPQDIGEKVYTVSVPTYNDEISITNNHKDFLLTLLREKIRILYLCGQANYEYAFLRNVLKGDPTIELVSFVILRNPENIALYPDDQLSLIPFPAHEIFVKELYNYDIVILENFTYTRFGISIPYLQNLHRFVTEKSGGLIMIGGDNAFGHGGYKGTPVEDLLPVEILGPEEKIETTLFRMQVENYTHPLLNLGETLQESLRIWQEMPELDSYNLLGKIKPNAIVLGIHPQTKTPILVVWEKGKGRILVMASNTTWRWALGLAGQGKSNLSYARFWQQAIRWLTHSEELKPVRIILKEKSFQQEEKIPVEVHIYDDKYRPLKAPSDLLEIKLFLTDPYGSRKINLSSGLNYTGEGKYFIEINPKSLGLETAEKLILQVDASLGKRYLGSDSVSFQILTVSEKDNVILNEELLDNLSALTGAKYFRLDEFNPDKITSPLREELVKVKAKINLWHQPYFYFLVCFFLTLEWYIRRKSGLL